jgi:hypothetical protein
VLEGISKMLSHISETSRAMQNPQVLVFHDFSGKLSEILKIYVSSLN